MTTDEALAALDAYLDTEHDPAARGAWTLPSDEPIGRATDTSGPRVRRRVFLVTRHRNALWGDVVAAYAGGDSDLSAGAYERVLYVAPTDAGPRVVAEHNVDPSTETVTWERIGGVALDEPGHVVEVRKIAAPDDPRDRAHWDAMEET